MFRRRIFVAIICMTTPGCPFYIIQTRNEPRSRPREIMSDGPFLHEASGITFPTVLAGCRRGRITSYSDSNDDIGATYESVNWYAHVFASIYVYPRRSHDYTSDMAGHFKKVVEEIVKQHANATIVSQRSTSLVRADGVARGRMAETRYETVLDLRNQEVKSFVFLLATANWFVKYRITYPESQSKVLEGVVGRILAGFSWKVGA